MHVAGIRSTSFNNGEHTRETTEQTHKTNIVTPNSPELLSSRSRK